MSLNLELLTIYLCNGLTLCGNKTVVFLDYISRIKETPMESPFRKMSVTHDMSKSEREINKQKVLEAKAMNEQDKSGKIKYIVKGPPWERKIIKVKKKEQES
jgi:hypothetical protein